MYKKRIKKSKLRSASKVTAFISNTTREKLEKEADKRKIPMSLIVAIALENEMSCDNPFEFDIDVSEIDVPDEDTNFTRALFDYIRYNGGLTLLHLVLLRLDYGILERSEVLKAYKHLKNIQVIKEVTGYNALGNRSVTIYASDAIVDKKTHYKRIEVQEGGVL